MQKNSIYLGVALFLSLLGLGLIAFYSKKNQDEMLRIIDAHIHTDFTGEKNLNGLPYTREQLLKEMRENNVVGGIAHTSFASKGYEDLSSENIIHCAGLNGKPGYTSWLEPALKIKKFKCIKVYLGYVQKYAFDVVYQEAYRLAKKYDVPVVFHTGDLYPPKGKLKYADPLTIDDVATDYPDVIFVIAHLGNPWIQSAAEVAYKNANVFLDASALLVGDLDEVTDVIKRTYVAKPIEWALGYVEDPSKIMFGTDWPLNKMSAYISIFKRAIPREHWQAVFHDNAVRIFKLDKK